MNFPQSEEWEIQEGWEQVVCEAVIKYPVAPREAKQILDLFGEMKNYGMTVQDAIVGLNKVIQERLDYRRKDNHK